MVAVGEVGVEHGGQGEAGEGDAQAGHQLGHTHRGGHGAVSQMPTLSNTGHTQPPLPTEDAAGLGWRLETSSGTRPTTPHSHTQQRLSPHWQFYVIQYDIFLFDIWHAFTSASLFISLQE